MNALLNGTEIFLMPTLNPDGFEESTLGFITGIPNFIAGRGSRQECQFRMSFMLHFTPCFSSRRRSNANLVDLNRNFPSWTEIKQSLKGNFDLEKNREKETMYVGLEKETIGSLKSVII